MSLMLATRGVGIAALIVGMLTWPASGLGVAADDAVKLSPSDVTVVTLPEKSRLVAVDPASGVAAVLVSADPDSIQGGAAVFYESLARTPLASPVAVELPGAKAMDLAPVLWKGERLFLVADDRDALHLADPKSGKVRASFKIAGQAVSVLASPDGALALYSVRRDRDGSRDRTPERQRQSLIGAVDLVSGEDKGLFMVEEGPNDHELLRSAGALRLAGFSHDGGYLYLSRLNTSPSGIRSCVINAAAGSIKIVNSEHESTDAYVATPVGTVCKGSLMSPSLGREVRKLGRSVEVALGGTPLVVGYLNSTTLAVMSLNSGAMVRSVSLPEFLAANRFERRARTGETTLYFDGASSRLLLDRSENIVSIGLGSLSVPEPFLGFAVKGPGVAIAGEPWRVELEPLSSGIILSLEKAPPGSAVSGSAVQWTPAVEDIGPQVIAVEVTAGGASATQGIEVEVRAPALDLPFAPGQVSASGNGAYLAIVRSEPMLERPEPSRAALVELARRAIVLDTPIDFGVADVAVTDSGTVLLADRNADAIHGITPAGEARVVYTKGRPQRIVCAGDRVFVSMTGRTGATTAVFSAADLAPLDAGKEDQEERPRGGPRDELPVRYEQGWLFDGIVRSADFKAIEMVQTLGGHFDGRLTAAASPFPAQERLREDVKWGVSLRGNSLQRISGQTIADSRGAGRILWKHPLAVFVRFDQGREANPDRAWSGYVLDVVELATGKARWLPAVFARHGDASRFGRGAAERVFEHPGGIGVVIENRVVFFTYGQLGSARAGVPLHFVPRAGPAVVPSSGPTTVQYEVLGGTVPVTYSLGRALEGVSIDKSRPILTIEPAKLGLKAIEQQACERAIQQAQTAAIRTGSGPVSNEDLPERMNWRELFRREREAVISEGGVEVKGIPVPLSIGLRARDANQQEAVLSHELVLDLSLDSFDAAYAARREEMLRQGRRIREQQQANNPNKQLAEENQKLKDEIERLKGQIEILRQLLDEQKKKQ